MDAQTKSQIEGEIASTDVVLFMKGTPVFPQCGFSAAVVGVLSHLGITFRGVNVLEDDAVREGCDDSRRSAQREEGHPKGAPRGGAATRYYHGGRAT